MKRTIDMQELIDTLAKVDTTSIESVKTFRETITRIDEMLFKNSSIAIRGAFIHMVDKAHVKHRSTITN
jgi:hypothetical protein